MSGSPELLTVHAIDGTGRRGALIDAAVWTGLGCHPLTVVSAVVAAGPDGEAEVVPLDAALLSRQCAAIAPRRPRVTRTGLVAGATQIASLAAWLERGSGGAVVVAPALAAGGAPFRDPVTLQALRERLLPLARVLVLRAGDVKRLLGRPVESWEEAPDAAAELRAIGPRAVLITGLRRDDRVLDVLDDDGDRTLLDAGRIAAPRVPGLEDVHAAALSAHLALGASLARAAQAAQRHVAARLTAAC